MSIREDTAPQTAVSRVVWGVFVGSARFSEAAGARRLLLKMRDQLCCLAA